MLLKLMDFEQIKTLSKKQTSSPKKEQKISYSLDKKKMIFYNSMLKISQLISTKYRLKKALSESK